LRHLREGIVEYVILWILCAIFSAVMASSKNRSPEGWFLIGLFFGPFGLLVALMPKVEPPVVSTRSCPFCAEQIQLAAIVCKHCGRDLPDR
jgi:hypothetical protein